MWVVTVIETGEELDVVPEWDDAKDIIKAYAVDTENNPNEFSATARFEEGI